MIERFELFTSFELLSSHNSSKNFVLIIWPIRANRLLLINWTIWAKWLSWVIWLVLTGDSSQLYQFDYFLKLFLAIWVIQDLASGSFVSYGLTGPSKASETLLNCLQLRKIQIFGTSKLYSKNYKNICHGRHLTMHERRLRLEVWRTLIQFMYVFRDHKIFIRNNMNNIMYKNFRKLWLLTWYLPALESQHPFYLLPYRIASYHCIVLSYDNVLIFVTFLTVHRSELNHHPWKWR